MKNQYPIGTLISDEYCVKPIYIFQYYTVVLSNMLIKLFIELKSK